MSELKMTEMDKTRGERLKRCRCAAGLSKTKLGEFIGISVQHVYNIEEGKRRLTDELAIKAAKTLNVPAAFLLGTEPLYSVIDERLNAATIALENALYFLRSTKQFIEDVRGAE